MTLPPAPPRRPQVRCFSTLDLLAALRALPEALRESHARTGRRPLVLIDGLTSHAAADRATRMGREPGTTLTQSRVQEALSRSVQRIAKHEHAAVVVTTTSPGRVNEGGAVSPAVSWAFRAPLLACWRGTVTARLMLQPSPRSGDAGVLLARFLQPEAPEVHAFRVDAAGAVVPV